jgi:N-acetylglutamate synthase-like GNAT family acetyltransferase
LPEYRNRGIGSALVTAAEDGARYHGVRELYLYTERAETLYARLDWRTIDRVDFNDQAAAIMSKLL